MKQHYKFETRRVKKLKQKSYIWLKFSKKVDSNGKNMHSIVLMYNSSNRNEKTAEYLFNGFTG